MAKTLFELAEDMIDDAKKKAWLEKYLADPACFDKFMELWLQKTTAEGIKKKPAPNKPPRIE
jgi:hypothetical protein